jgi:DNA-binding response OmpR family regulator
MTSMEITSKILIVDDDPISLMILDGYLQNPRYDIHTIDDPEKALAAARELDPDMILLDIMMKNISGLEVCRSLKKDESTRNIPVLFITALSDRDAHRKAIECGGEGFIVKPLEEKLVRAYVRAFLGLRQANKDIRKKLAAANELVGMSMHDLNNMMGAVTANIELAMLDNEQSLNVDTYLQRSLSILKSTHDMIEKLQTMAFIESRVRTSGFQTVSMGELMAETAWVLGTEMEAKGLKLNLPEIGLLSVRGEKDLLVRVLVNLMENAVKFAWPGSAIHIRAVDHNKPREPGGEAADQAACLEFIISNHCDPVHPADQKQVFDKFGRGRNAKNGTRGRGLGLAFCKLVIESHGGKIWIESPLPHQETGVAIHFTLPRAQTREEACELLCKN